MQYSFIVFIQTALLSSVLQKNSHNYSFYIFIHIIIIYLSFDQIEYSDFLLLIDDFVRAFCIIRKYPLIL